MWHTLISVGILFLSLPYVVTQSTGWRMIDRFYGFRFEIEGPRVINVGFETTIQQKADELGCFGWVQESRSKSIVGEARCSKSNGPKFEDWMKSDHDGAKTAIKVYDDTKIRLHFAYFKILDKTRDTCFLDPPHMCPAMADRENLESTSSDEL